jgi:putative endonuclease
LEARSRKLTARQAGRDGEEAAALYLESRGWRILARRFRVRGGEVDLVAEKDGTVAFVEVKTRSPGALDDGRGAVTPAKRRRLALAAGAYLARSGLGDHPCRFDVISVSLAGGRPEFRHLAGAFDIG